MPSMKHLLCIPILLLALAGCAHVPPKPTTQNAFQFETDTFAFNNETKWHYVEGVRKPELEEQENENKRYTQRCFIVCRAAMQFRKFARFDPSLPKLNSKELADRVRQLCRQDVWRDPLPESERMVFPGYANLKELSRDQAACLQDHIGESWPTYVRPGNFSIIVKPSEAHQARTNEELQQWITSGYPMILWLYNFPKQDINHATVAYAFTKENDRIVYTVYDPNISEHPMPLEYDPGSKTFSFPKTFYFAGGKVSVRPVYLSMFQ